MTIPRLDNDHDNDEDRGRPVFSSLVVLIVVEARSVTISRLDNDHDNDEDRGRPVYSSLVVLIVVEARSVTTSRLDNDYDNDVDCQPTVSLVPDGQGGATTNTLKGFYTHGCGTLSGYN